MYNQTRNRRADILIILTHQLIVPVLVQAKLVATKSLSYVEPISDWHSAHLRVFGKVKNGTFASLSIPNIG